MKKDVKGSELENITNLLWLSVLLRTVLAPHQRTIVFHLPVQDVVKDLIFPLLLIY